MARTAHTARKQVSRASEEEDPGVKKVVKTQQTARKQVLKTERTAEKKPSKIPAKSLSVSVPKISQKPTPTPRKISTNILKEIKYYQRNIGFLIPRALLVRVVRQTLISTLKSPNMENLKFTAIALNVIHEAIENHIVCILELSYMAARHAKRVTLFPSDIRLIKKIRGAGTQ
ncbi:centromeric DNA-binding histone H3-like protein cse4 [Glugoides intestinalis]